jgi:hypothetical protein
LAFIIRTARLAGGIRAEQILDLLAQRSVTRASVVQVGWPAPPAEFRGSVQQGHFPIRRLAHGLMRHSTVHHIIRESEGKSAEDFRHPWHR